MKQKVKDEKIYFWIGLFLLGFLWQSFAGQNSVAWLTTTAYNFGQIPQHQIQSHRFYFKNNSPESISIDNVRTTCGCTASEWEDKAILPDSTGFIHITYDAKQIGAFKKRIKVFFVHQRAPETLLVEGLVQ
ncbi:MAG: DUF1573 domain-containing protein [Saprospiraceae bacterium]|nr:DUF1573 domain-containing protein [Saprospiraceae bacterium]